jgi:superoxide dismutase, Cu-Zn family
MTARHYAAFALVALLAASCHPSASSRQPTVRSATAEMRSASGVSYGTLTLERNAAGVRISGALTGVPVGVHGIHFHQTGRCDAPDFATAGPHLNPAHTAHGLENPRGPHAGDLPNVVANEAGQMVVDIATPRVILGSGVPTGLFDSDGTAIVLHANADDQRTDPAGNSGARIACGVVTAG